MPLRVAAPRLTTTQLAFGDVDHELGDHFGKTPSNFLFHFFVTSSSTYNQGNIADWKKSDLHFSLQRICDAHFSFSVVALLFFFFQIHTSEEFLWKTFDLLNPEVAYEPLAFFSGALSILFSHASRASTPSGLTIQILFFLSLSLLPLSCQTLPDSLESSVQSFPACCISSTLSNGIIHSAPSFESKVFESTSRSRSHKKCCFLWWE